MAGLRLIVGLGNPGAEYLRTRHNAGFWFIDALARRESARFGNETKLHGETAKITLDGQQLWLLKPNTFVNKSGIAVASALRLGKEHDLAVVIAKHAKEEVEEVAEVPVAAEVPSTKAAKAAAAPAAAAPAKTDKKK